MAGAPDRESPWQVAKVVAIRDEPARARTFRLALAKPVAHRAGQHFVVRLTAPDGYTASRSYSLASPPDGTGEVELTVERLEGGAVRVSSRMDIDDLNEIFGVDIEDEDVETVGGLMAKLLGKVPIPGAEVSIEGLSLTAERPSGRRNQVGTVLVRREEPTPAPQDQNHQHA